MAKNTTPLESCEQINFFLWVKFNHPNLIIFSIPNGNLRNKAVAAKLKREGVLPGVSDIFCPELKLWIEMKRVKGSSTSKEQRQFLADMIKLGYRAEIAKGFIEAKKIVLKYLNEDKQNE